MRNRWFESKKTKQQQPGSSLLASPFFQLRHSYFVTHHCVGPDNRCSFLAFARRCVYSVQYGNHRRQRAKRRRTRLAISKTREKKERSPFPAVAHTWESVPTVGLKIVHKGFSIIQATLLGRGLIIKPECLPPL